MKALFLVHLKDLSVLGCTIILSSFNIFSQPANLTSGGYYQDFGATNITTWTDNSTFPGWYLKTTTASGNAGGTYNFRGNQNITNSAPSNDGGFYSYRCSGGNNQKIGTRPSNSSPAGVGSYLLMGLILTNTSEETIHYIEVTYTAYQFSLAANGDNANTLEFHWATGNSININLVTGTYNAVSDLTFTAPQSSSNTGGNQLNGYPCTEFQVMTACISLGAGGLLPGHQIALRWGDRNDTHNDHHLGIDDISVYGYSGVSNPCASPLAIDIINFEGKYQHSQANLSWATSAEQNNSHFTIFRSQDGFIWENIGRIAGAGSSNELLQYEFTDYFPFKGINYYRLESTDFDGTTHNKGIVTLETENQHVYFNTLTSTIELLQNESVEIYSIDGKLMAVSSGVSSIPFSNSGIFLIHFVKSKKTERIITGVK